MHLPVRSDGSAVRGHIRREAQRLHVAQQAKRGVAVPQVGVRLDALIKHRLAQSTPLLQRVQQHQRL